MSPEKENYLYAPKDCTMKPRTCMKKINRVNLTLKQFFSMVKSLWHTACEYNIKHIRWKPASAKHWQWLLNCIKACIILWHIEMQWCMCRHINSDCNLFMASLYMRRKMLRGFGLLLSLIWQRLMGWNGEAKWKDQWRNRERELLKRSNERGRQRLTPQRRFPPTIPTDYQKRETRK